MRSIIAAVTLAGLAGCVSLQRPARAQRGAVAAATCDSAASIAAERAHLASVAQTLADLSNGAGRNAYSAAQASTVAPHPSAPAPSASAAAVSSSMIANANNARVDLWSAEARQELGEYEVVIRQIAALDAVARTLPTTKSCRAAGFATSTEPTG